MITEPTSPKHPSASLSGSRRPCLVSLSSERMWREKTRDVFRDAVAGNIPLPASATGKLAVTFSFDLLRSKMQACKWVTSKYFTPPPYTRLPPPFVISRKLASTDGVTKSSAADYKAWHGWVHVYRPLITFHCVIFKLSPLKLRKLMKYEAKKKDAVMINYLGALNIEWAQIDPR